jgi:hypothetical protein
LSRKFLKISFFALIVAGLTACERPANISPVGPLAPTAPAAAAATIVPAEAKAVTPTLMIKTPVKVATQASGFQEILSATQTAVATIRSGTLTATAMGISGTAFGTPGTPGTPMAGTGTPGTPMAGTPMALGTIYPATATVAGTQGALIGTPGPNGTPGAITGTMVIPTATKFIANFPIIPGVPTFGIQSVVGDGTVTIVTSEFPPSSKYTVYMGAAGTRGYGGTLLGTFDTEKGGQKTLVFNIPATLHGYSPIDMRIEFPDGRYTYNFFYNITAN